MIPVKSDYFLSRPSREAVPRSHLEYVVSRWYIRDVDPLAVDVGVIRIVATRTEPLRKTQTYITLLLV